MIKPTRQIFSVNEIVPADYNPRKISKKQKAGLSASLDRFGYLQDIIVNIRGGLNVIVGGHKRLEALSLPVTEQIECTVVDLSPIEEKALNVALNNRHTGGDYDQDGLEAILSELKEWEGFDDLNFDDLVVEFDLVLGEVGEFDPTLPTGGKPEIKTVTFTLSNEQHALIEKLIKNEIKTNPLLDDPSGINENKNGNALYSIMRAYDER
jgi:hypothetical protein